MLSIADMHGFKHNHNFIFKEFACYDLSEVKGVIFDKPFAWKSLNNMDRKTNRYLTYRFHGLRWNAKGDVPYDMLKVTLQSALDNSIILVKGADKIKWLSEFLPDARIIDLTLLGCPAFKNLPSVDYVCENHIMDNICAIKQVLQLKDWCAKNEKEVLSYINH